MNTVRRRFNALVDDGTGWTATVIALTAVAVLVRLVIIAHSHGGEDLRMYVYFRRLCCFRG
jgi:triacylglycerol esterase/lipase EstA (alpha/beta hydrolase family)